MAFPYQQAPPGYNNISAQQFHQAHQAHIHTTAAPPTPPAARMNIHVPMISNATDRVDQPFDQPHTYSEPDDEDEEPTTHSLSSTTEISLSIQTPLIIEGNDNTIAIDASSAASRITLAVVQGLKQICCLDEVGLPMIDEEGRPRPIRVRVQAETRVKGCKNVAGEKAILTSMGGVGTAKVAAKKRERAGSEEPEIALQIKKARRE